MPILPICHRERKKKIKKYKKPTTHESIMMQKNTHRKKNLTFIHFVNNNKGKKQQ